MPREARIYYGVKNYATEETPRAPLALIGRYERKNDAVDGCASYATQMQSEGCEVLGNSKEGWQVNHPAKPFRIEILEKPDMMNRPVLTSSSMIRQIGYLPESQELPVMFTNGGVYHYLGVDEQTFLDLLAEQAASNGSVGRLFNAMVKGKFPCQKKI
jgi:hypothetical protein